MSAPFTKEEESVWENLINAHNQFIKLPNGHPSDMHDWITAIHQLQSIMMCRITARDYPDVFTQPKAKP